MDYTLTLITAFFKITFKIPAVRQLAELVIK